MRLIVLLTASVIAIAAPLRTWCEATCLPPAHHADSSAKPHCPTSEPAGSEARISAGNLDDCPIVEAARPTTLAKLDFHRVAANTHPDTFEPSHLRTKAPGHPGTLAPRHPRHLSFIPLRL
jgi:hypothetical protein